MASDPMASAPGHRLLRGLIDLHGDVRDFQSIQDLGAPWRRRLGSGVFLPFRPLKKLVFSHWEIPRKWEIYRNLWNQPVWLISFMVVSRRALHFSQIGHNVCHHHPNEIRCFQVTGFTISVAFETSCPKLNSGRFPCRERTSDGAELAMKKRGR